MVRTVFVLLFVLLLGRIDVALAGTQKCRGLALEGGGDRGAYQAGIINALVQNLPPEEVAYDVVSGISAGSVNGAVFALYPKGQERNVTDLMTTVWHTLSAPDIFKNWPLGPIEGLVSESGLVDTTPLRELLENIIGERSYKERDLFFGTNDINTGVFHSLHNMDLTREEAIDAVLSSSAVPFIFPTIRLNNMVDVDGGTKLMMSTDPIITECRKRGFADEDIIVDAGYCFGYHIPPVEYKDLKTWKMIGRVMDLFVSTILPDYIPKLKRTYPNVNFRYFVMPSEEETVPDFPFPLVFIHEDIEKMLKAGFGRAVEVINAGPGVAFEQMVRDAEKERSKTNASESASSPIEFIFQPDSTYYIVD